MGAKLYFGAGVKRTEDPALLTGKGRFVDDIRAADMLHAAFVRSPHAHARIRAIGKDTARAVPGVHAVLSFEDLPEALRTARLPLIVPHPAIRQPRMPWSLAKDEVCYAGEPVAVVVADSRYIAEDAATLVEVDWEPLPAVTDIRAAIESGSPVAHAGAPSNVVAQFPVKFGDADAAFRKAPHVFRESLRQHRGGAFFIECRGAIANWDAATGTITIHASTQSSHRLKRVLGELLGLADHELRVVTPDVGGGFGPKGSFYPEYAVITACAMQLDRPVKWIEDRRENFLTTHQERDQQWDVEIAVDGEGRIQGLRGRLLHENGAYIPLGIVLPWIAATTVPGPYVVPAFDLDVVCVFTNKIQTTPVRGAGRPEAAFTMERLMDRVARELGLDRAEVRRRNFIRPEQMPYDVGLVFRDGKPVTYDSGDYPGCQAAALERIGYDGFRERQAQARTEGRLIGIGIGNCVEGTGLGPYEGATVRIATTGRIVLYTGATPQGQGHKTTFAQIVADQLGVDFRDVSVVTGDTAGIALGMGTFASRSAVNAGNSAHIAAGEVRDKIKKIAAGLMEVAEDDLELEAGSVRVRGVPEMKKTFREIAVASIGMPGFALPGGLPPGLEHTAYFTPAQSTYANGTHVAEVEVDAATGRVRILRYVIAHDCGTVINPMVVDGQVEGGVAHGVGNALFEELKFDANAQPLTVNFGEYLLPTAPDVPNVEIEHRETPSPLNPLGVKGAGEGGTIPAIAAIISAIEDALSPYGVRIAEAPVAPHRLVELAGYPG